MESTKKKIITIAGRPGSGKSSTATGLAATLGYQHFSSGDLFRALWKERGYELFQANLTAEQNAEIDHLVDERIQTIGSTEDRVVIDSRTAWHWIPSSFKVFLDLDLEVAAKRILDNMDDKRLESEHVQRDPAEYAQILQKRLESESRRYKALYDIDPYVMSNYDLVIDTATHNLGEVIETLAMEYRKWIEAAGRHL